MLHGQAIERQRGGFGFLGMDTTLGNADASELSVVDYNGGKALDAEVRVQTPGGEQAFYITAIEYPQVSAG